MTEAKRAKRRLPASILDPLVNQVEPVVRCKRCGHWVPAEESCPCTPKW